MNAQKPFPQWWRAAGLTSAVVILGLLGLAAEKAPSSTPKTAKTKEAAEKEPVLPSPLAKRWELTDNTLHRDFPAMALDASGAAWVAFVEHDGKADVLKLARKTARGLRAAETLSEPGVIHQPAVACGAD